MTAGRYWRFSPKFWDSVCVEDWSDDAIILGAYLFTCRHRTTEGLFRLPKSYIVEDLPRWDLERLAEPLAELQAKGFVEVDEASKWVLLTGALKHQAPENPNQVKAAARRLLEVPSKSPLTSTFKGLCEQFSQGLLEALPRGFGQPDPEPKAIANALDVVAEPAPEPSIDECQHDSSHSPETIATGLSALSDARAALRALPDPQGEAS